MGESIGLVMIGAAVVGLLATIVIMRRQRHEVEASTGESPFAASTEGEKICPRCGMGNLWTDSTCVACGTHLRG